MRATRPECSDFVADKDLRIIFGRFSFQGEPQDWRRSVDLGGSGVAAAAAAGEERWAARPGPPRRSVFSSFGPASVGLSVSFLRAARREWCNFTKRGNLFVAMMSCLTARLLPFSKFILLYFFSPWKCARRGDSELLLYFVRSAAGRRAPRRGNRLSQLRSCAAAKHTVDFRPYWNHFRIPHTESSAVHTSARSFISFKIPANILCVAFPPTHNGVPSVRQYNSWER